MTRQEFEEKLSLIGYKIKGHLPNAFVFDNKNNNTGMRVWNESVEKKIGSVSDTDRISLGIYFDRIKIEQLSETTLSIRSISDPENSGFFINLYAH